MSKRLKQQPDGAKQNTLLTAEDHEPARSKSKINPNFEGIMKAMLVFNRRYFVLLVALLVIEVFIALYVHDNFIRPYLGDFLVVILMYCFLKSFLKLSVWKAAVLVWLFSFFIEWMQYLDLIGILGLEHSKIARMIIGHSFSWMDLFAYTAGMVTVIFMEKFFSEEPCLG